MSPPRPVIQECSAPCVPARRHFAAYFPLAMVAVVAATTGCARTPAGPEDLSPGEIVLVDSKTGEVFRAPAGTAAPAAHPATGKKTLLRGMYCPACNRWNPVPPLEVLQRSPSAGQCPSCKSKLVTSGPIPDSAAVLPGAD